MANIKALLWYSCGQLACMPGATRQNVWQIYHSTLKLPPVQACVLWVLAGFNACGLPQQSAQASLNSRASAQTPMSCALGPTPAFNQESTPLLGRVVHLDVINDQPAPFIQSSMASASSQQVNHLACEQACSLMLPSLLPQSVSLA